MTIPGTTVGTRKFTFRIEITGIGDNPEEAWLDATESFGQNPGGLPSQYIEEDRDTDGYNPNPLDRYAHE